MIEHLKLNKHAPFSQFFIKMMRKLEGNKNEKSQQEYYMIRHRTMYTQLVICIRCTRVIKKTKAVKIRKRCIGNDFLQRACPEHRKLSNCDNALFEKFKLIGLEKWSTVVKSKR